MISAERIPAPDRPRGGRARADRCLHTRLAALCFDRFKDVWHARLGVIEAASSDLFEPFYQVVVIWLMIIFALFGLVAPFNLLSIITIVLSLPMGRVEPVWQIRLRVLPLNCVPITWRRCLVSGQLIVPPVTRARRLLS